MITKYIFYGNIIGSGPNNIKAIAESIVPKHIKNLKSIDFGIKLKSKVATAYETAVMQKKYPITFSLSLYCYII